MLSQLYRTTLVVGGYIGGSCLVHGILEVSPIAHLRCMILEIVHNMINLLLIPYSIFTNWLRHITKEENRGKKNSTSHQHIPF